MSTSCSCSTTVQRTLHLDAPSHSAPLAEVLAVPNLALLVCKALYVHRELALKHVRVDLHGGIGIGVYRHKVVEGRPGEDAETRHRVEYMLRGWKSGVWGVVLSSCYNGPVERSRSQIAGMRVVTSG